LQKFEIRKNNSKNIDSIENQNWQKRASSFFIQKMEVRLMLKFLIGMFVGANVSLWLYAIIMAGKEGDEKKDERNK